ncbi:hypothetical protein [Streptomyces sp. NBC_00557]|uniref:hypothetical protein n=1 Tax=Streptomyces sp. NBC_00557 TaxID=2975776 RepID=UPI002E80A532|nr:hypothetical protein [Streptomyces sp. NBC_00557]WUC36375.1 hypothetical protein OG956_20200 [Streptomyces sp. NBC_00557]
MLLITVLCLAGLAPGLATVWLVRRHTGWLLAVLAGVGVTAALPFLLLASLVLFPPLGIAVGLAAALAALRSYDRGRIWSATAWAGLTVLAVSCTRWFR